MIKYRYRGKFDPHKLAVDNIDRLSTSLVTPKQKILELGGSHGYMSRYFREKLNCRVVNADINPSAKPSIIGDLNQSNTWRMIRAQAPYDLVFASAILEHLSDPESAVHLIKSVLKPEGKLIVTLPNIAHWRSRISLLLGRFEYEDYGIYDRTHLRFFTYFTGQKLITDAGFSIKQVLVDPAGGMKYLNWLARWWPNLYAHQFCIYAINH